MVFMGRNLFRNSFLLILILIAWFWVGGLVWFTGQIPKTFPGDIEPVDGIVVLTGGSERLQTGFLMMRKHLGKQMLISGVGRDTTLAEILETSDIPEEEVVDFESDITLGYMASNTEENAYEAHLWVMLHDLETIRVVTANYHIPRSKLEFSRIFDPEIKISYYPVFPSHVKTEQWWRFPGSSRLILSEYHKYIRSLFHITSVNSL